MFLFRKLYQELNLLRGLGVSIYIFIINQFDTSNMNNYVTSAKHSIESMLYFFVWFVVFLTEGNICLIILQPIEKVNKGLKPESWLDMFIIKNTLI